VRAAPERRLRVVASTCDSLAQGLSELASEDGWSVELLTHSEAALDTTVEVNEDGVRVSPAVALWLRPSFDGLPADADSRFLVEERLSLLWAAAVLSSLPVLARPSTHGLWGRKSASARVTEHRAGIPDTRPEVFCTQSTGRAWAGAWAAERGDGVVTRWPARGPGPFRARPIVEGEEYEAVTVVGTQAWRRSAEPLAHLALERQSVSVVKALSLDLAVVWWAIPAGENESARLARVNAIPSMDEVASHWPEVGHAALALLL
jgi:hypothetical protein